MAKPKIPSEGDSIPNLADIKSLEILFDDQEFVESLWPAITFVCTVRQKLINGARNRVLRENLAPALSLDAVATLLLDISSSNAKYLPQVVKKGFDELGIPYLARKKGRPLGRQQDYRLLFYVDQVQKHVEELRIFEAKDTLKATKRRNWFSELEASLERYRWPAHIVDLVFIRQNPRSFATDVVGTLFGFDYSYVSRACRRAKQAQK